MVTHPEFAGDATTLKEALDRFEATGYTGQFAARAGTQVICFTCHEESPAANVGLAALIRIEGASDPDDEVAVAALDCPRCQAKGTVALTYGPEAPVDDAEVLAALEDRRRAAGVDTTA